jgi:hypothetical protein
MIKTRILLIATLFVIATTNQSFTNKAIVAENEKHAGDNQKQSVSGGGSVSESIAGEERKSTFSFSAVGKGSGTEASGNIIYHYKVGGISIHGKISNMQIVENTASFTGVITKVDGKTPEAFGFVKEGSSFTFNVIDDEQSGDKVSDFMVYPTNPPFFSTAAYLSISGNISIKP